jgi:hypothetical protein
MELMNLRTYAGCVVVGVEDYWLVLKATREVVIPLAKERATRFHN